MTDKHVLQIFSLFFISFLFFVNTVSAQSELEKAVEWLKTNQNDDGSWALVTQGHLTASAMIALYEAGEYNASNKASYWLKQQIENFSSAVWKAEEADIPAIIIHSFYAVKNESAIGIVNVSEKLMSYQNMDNESKYYGGFKGFREDGETSVENTVDTALSLIALWDYENFTNRGDISINFLKKLQNEDGDFNLTFNTKNHSLYSLAPDPISLTALASIALNEAGEDNPEAIEFLKSSARSCFGNEGRSYSAALSAIAFDEVAESEYAEATANYLKILQNNDGGFSDYTRQNPGISNALDTAWTAIALNIENITSDVCAPLDAELAMDNEIIQLGGIKNISLNILGAVSTAAINLTYPNGTLVELPINYSKSVAHYEIIFNDTNQIGTYNVSAQIKPIYGKPVIFSDSFEIENETSDNTTTTTEPTTTTSATTTAQASGGGTTSTTTSITTSSTSSTTTPTTTATASLITTSTTTTSQTTTTTTSSPLTGMFSLISNYSIYYVVILIAVAAVSVFLIWKKFFRKRNYQSFYYQRQPNF